MQPQQQKEQQQQQPYHRDWLRNSWTMAAADSSGSSSSSNMIWNGLVGGALIAVYAPLTLVGVLISVPLVGLVRVMSLAGAFPPWKKPAIQKDDEVWRYRLEMSSIRMLELHAATSSAAVHAGWGPSMRKLMAIRELGDVPYEVWMDFVDAADGEATAAAKNKNKNAEHMLAYAKLYGTAMYSGAIRAEAVRIANEHYAREFLEEQQEGGDGCGVSSIDDVHRMLDAAFST